MKLKTFQNKNSNEEAKNSSTKIGNVASQFYQTSLYVAAIGKCMGYEGLDHSLTMTKDGVEYTFDFYHRQSQTLFKVFRGDDLSEYPKYAPYPGNRAILIDVEYADEPVGWTDEAEDVLLMAPKKIGDLVRDARQTLFYFKNHLWEVSGTTNTGRWIYRAIEPAVLVQMGLMKRG